MNTNALVADLEIDPCVTLCDLEATETTLGGAADVSLRKRLKGYAEVRRVGFEPRPEAVTRLALRFFPATSPAQRLGMSGDSFTGDDSGRLRAALTKAVRVAS